MPDQPEMVEDLELDAVTGAATPTHRQQLPVQFTTRLGKSD